MAVPPFRRTAPLLAVSTAPPNSDPPHRPHPTALRTVRGPVVPAPSVAIAFPPTVLEGDVLQGPQAMAFGVIVRGPGPIVSPPIAGLPVGSGSRRSGGGIIGGDGRGGRPVAVRGPTRSYGAA